MEKRKITLTAIILGVVLVALFGSTYAYFTSNNNPQSSTQAIIQTGALSLILDDVDGITEEDKIDANHTEIVKYFSITNNGTQDAYAKLIFKGLTNTFVRDDLVYELEEVQSDKSSFSTPRIELSETVVPKSSTPSNQVLADSILIEKGTITNNTITPNTKYYKLTVRYKYSNTENQNDDLNKTLTSGFTIEEGTYQTRLLTTNGVEMRLDNSNISTTISPNGSIQKTFRLRNNTNTTQKVDVELTNISNTNTNMTASLIKDGTVIVDNITIPVGNNETVVLKKGVEIPSNDNSTYTITINNTDTNSSNISANVNMKENVLPVLYTIDGNGNEIENTGTFTPGQRIALGRGEQKEYFYFLRMNGNKIKLITETVKEKSKWSDDNSYDYNTSLVKVYVDNYVSNLNALYFNSENVIKGMLITRDEALAAGIPSNPVHACKKAPAWISGYNYSYWTMSTFSTNGGMIYYVGCCCEYGSAGSSTYPYNSQYIRPVIELDASLLQ